MSLLLSEDDETTDPSSLELEEVLDVMDVLSWRIGVGGRARLFVPNVSS